MYATFLERMGNLYDPKKIKGLPLVLPLTMIMPLNFIVSDGKFGAMMSVGLTNEGPVTFNLDSRIDESGLGTSGASTPVLGGGSKVNKGAQRGAEKALRKAAWESAKGAPSSKDVTEQERSRADIITGGGVAANDAQTLPSHDTNTADNQITH